MIGRQRPKLREDQPRNHVEIGLHPRRGTAGPKSVLKSRGKHPAEQPVQAGTLLAPTAGPGLADVYAMSGSKHSRNCNLPAMWAGILVGRTP